MRGGGSVEFDFNFSGNALCLQGGEIKAFGGMVDIKTHDISVGVDIDIESSRLLHDVSAPGPALNST